MTSIPLTPHDVPLTPQERKASRAIAASTLAKILAGRLISVTLVEMAQAYERAGIAGFQEMLVVVAERFAMKTDETRRWVQYTYSDGSAIRLRWTGAPAD